MLASLGRMSVEVTLFTDPACPFAFSAEPVRQRLRWHYGDQLVWSTRMIVLTDEPGEAEKLAAGAPNLQRRYGMPIDPAPYPRASSSSRPALRSSLPGSTTRRPPTGYCGACGSAAWPAGSWTTPR